MHRSFGGPVPSPPSLSHSVPSTCPTVGGRVAWCHWQVGCLTHSHPGNASCVFDGRAKGCQVSQGIRGIILGTGGSTPRIASQRPSMDRDGKDGSLPLSSCAVLTGKSTRVELSTFLLCPHFRRLSINVCFGNGHIHLQHCSTVGPDFRPVTHPASAFFWVHLHCQGLRGPEKPSPSSRNPNTRGARPNIAEQAGASPVVAALLLLDLWPQPWECLPGGTCHRFPGRSSLYPRFLHPDTPG
jgi:hypothetical protein